MRFYRLSDPDYESDREMDRNNPIDMVWGLTLPAVLCPACGRLSAPLRVRIHMDVPSTSALRALPESSALPVQEWDAFVKRLRQEGWLPASVKLEPGAEIGMPKAVLKSTHIPDIMHPFPGVFIVRARVVEALQTAGIKGFKPVKVELSWGRQVKDPPPELPELYDLEVQSSVWPIGVDEASVVSRCEFCGRRKYPEKLLVIDENRWDGSDFVRLEPYYMVCVTERVCQVFSERGFRNFACKRLTVYDAEFVPRKEGQALISIDPAPLAVHESRDDESKDK